MKSPSRLRSLVRIEVAIAAAIFSWPAAGYVANRSVVVTPAKAPVSVEVGQDPSKAELLPTFVLAGVVPSMMGPLSSPSGGEVVLEGMRVPTQVLGTVVKAAASTGVDAAYLCALADKESGWSRGARSRASSAAGLFQFLEGTWLRMVKSHGSAWGLKEQADAIVVGRSGPRVADAGLRAKILALRHDPWISAVLAAEMVKRDRALVGSRIGRELNGTEAYLAHFLGPAGAGRVLSGGHRGKTVAALLPASAKANRALFYERKGRKMQPLGFDAFYGRLDQMIGARIRRYAAYAPPVVSAGP